MQFFSDTTMLNFTSSICLLTNYKSQKFVFCLHLFIDGVERAWPARYFFSSGNRRLPVVLYHSGKRFGL